MASLADVREALAVWFNLPPYMVDQLLTRITPTVDLEQLVAFAAERGGVAGPRHCFHSVSVAAVAAEYPRLQLMNPADSGVDISVRSLVVMRSTAGIIQVGFSNTALAGAGVNRYLDQRIGISPEFLVKHPAGRATYDTDAAVGIAAADQIERTRVLNERTVINFDARLVLPPGFGVRTVDETQNETYIATFYTTEIPRRLA